MAEPEVLRSPLLDGLPHGFLGRMGGVSTGVVAGLNVGLGAGDDPSAVQSNRTLAATAIVPHARLVTVYQVHSAVCATATAPWPEDDRPQADALVTNQPSLLLGIVTADCAPVLLADRAAGVIGAAHAGWKGALGGVTDATIAAMEALGARRAAIVAAVGPCIAQASYEVDIGFAARFEAADPANRAFFTPARPGHLQFDLAGYVAARLLAAGIAAALPLYEDTYRQDERFFSFRRATHRGEPTYGRQISAISLP